MRGADAGRGRKGWFSGRPGATNRRAGVLVGLSTVCEYIARDSKTAGGCCLRHEMPLQDLNAGLLSCLSTV